MSRPIKWQPGVQTDIDPDAVLDYTWDWTDWLSEGDSIASYELLTDGTVTIAAHARDGAKITAWVSAVTASGSVTCRVTTASSPALIDDRTVTFTGVHQ